MFLQHSSICLPCRHQCFLIFWKSDRQRPPVRLNNVPIDYIEPKIALRIFKHRFGIRKSVQSMGAFFVMVVRGKIMQQRASDDASAIEALSQPAAKQVTVICDRHTVSEAGCITMPLIAVKLQNLFAIENIFYALIKIHTLLLR